MAYIKVEQFEDKITSGLIENYRESIELLGEDPNREVNEHIISKFDHKNLNLDVPEFKELNPTAENIAKHLLCDICPQLFANHPIKCIAIKVHETPNCSAEITVKYE